MRALSFTRESVRYVPASDVDNHAIAFHTERAVLAYVPALVGGGRSGCVFDDQSEHLFLVEWKRHGGRE